MVQLKKLKELVGAEYYNKSLVRNRKVNESTVNTSVATNLITRIKSEK